ncbi:MAG: hypothetical protein NVS3B18_14960 [Candidatus Dormibacteria bacterium]
MHFRDLTRGELLAIVGGALLGVSLFLSWYSLGNRHATLGSCHGPHTTCTGWASLAAIRYVLLIAAIAPAILAYIIIRGHALSWPRGELTAVIAMLALVITIFLGVVAKPGMPSGEISVTDGWWLALVADLLILFGAVWRAQMSGAQRKPPGVL